MSRYACVRREGGRLVAEAADGREPVELDSAALGVLGAFAHPLDVPAAAAQAGIDPAAAAVCAERLRSAGVLVDAEEAAREQASPWAFADRLLHARTRPPVPASPVMMAPAPPVPPARWGEPLPLPAVDLDAFERDDPPLARVQADRASVREHAPPPLSLGELAQFLARVGRVHDIFYAAPGIETYARPYPAAGALYELELYVATGGCADLPVALHHYCGAEHTLAAVPGSGEHAGALLAGAAAAMAAPRPPQALVVIAARIGRLAWKYGGLSYTLVLKDAGVLLELMALSATAMGLGGCALGTGDARLFARATGLDPDHEAAVAEFALGRPA